MLGAARDAAVGEGVHNTIMGRDGWDGENRVWLGKCDCQVHWELTSVVMDCLALVRRAIVSVRRWTQYQLWHTRSGMVMCSHRWTITVTSQHCDSTVTAL